jgi:uridine kinase
MAERPILVAITGGSGAGKTSLALALAERAAPRSVLILSEDCYYHDNGAAPDFDAGRFNFDDVAAHDHALLARDLTLLRAGRAIDRPDYCYVTHRRRPETIPAEPAELVIVEGIHILHTEALRPLFDLSLYLDVPDDVRFVRRLLRDLRERERDPVAVAVQYLETVRPMHYRFTEPTRAAADLILVDDGRKEAIKATMARLLVPVEERLRALWTATRDLAGGSPAG